MNIWSYLEQHNINKQVNIEACRQLLFQTDKVSEVEGYLDNILKKLKFGNIEIITEARSVALPLVYRLAIDDTSNNFRIASKINSEIFRLENPVIAQCISEEIVNLILNAFNNRYENLNVLKEQILNELSEFTTELDDNWYAYGRVKEIFSIFSKFYKFKTNKKSPKQENENINLGIRETLNLFEENVSLRMQKKNILPDQYSTEILKWLIPDLMAFTLQQSIKSNHTRNLGSLKSKYKSVHNKLLVQFPISQFYGPSYSNKWHINRLVSYGLWSFGNYSIPIELFIRTDFDYFIGYANYWRYKDVDLFSGSHLDSTIKDQKRMIERIHECRSFSQVQYMLYKDLKSGQLDLF